MPGNEGMLVTSQGTTPSGTADSGNPVKFGGVYLSTLSGFTTGQRADLPVNSNGVLLTSTGLQVGGADGFSNGSLLSFWGVNGTTSAVFGPSQVAGSYFNGTSWDRVRGDTTGAYTVAKGTPTLGSGQIAVATASTQIVAARAGRASVTIANPAAAALFVGPTGVTVSTGHSIPAGGSLTLNTSAAVFGVAAAGQTATFIEAY